MSVSGYDYGPSEYSRHLHGSDLSIGRAYDDRYASKDADAGGDTLKPSARKRTNVACARCRRRKIKCSGDKGDGRSCKACQNDSNEAKNCIFTRVASTPLGYLGGSCVTQSQYDPSQTAGYSNSAYEVASDDAYRQWASSATPTASQVSPPYQYYGNLAVQPQLDPYYRSTAAPAFTQHPNFYPSGSGVTANNDYVMPSYTSDWASTYGSAQTTSGSNGQSRTQRSSKSSASSSSRASENHPILGYVFEHDTDGSSSRRTSKSYKSSSTIGSSALSPLDTLGLQPVSSGRHSSSRSSVGYESQSSRSTIPSAVTSSVRASESGHGQGHGDSRRSSEKSSSSRSHHRR